MLKTFRTYFKNYELFLYFYTRSNYSITFMSLTPNENNIPLTKFESMLKTNSVYFFDSVEFEEIIHYYIDSGKNALAKKAIKLGLKQHPNSIILKLLQAELLIFDDEFDAAGILLREIQAIEPTNDEVYVQQASIFSKRDNHKKAIDLLTIALAYTDEKADVLAMIGMEYLFLDDFDEARLNFAKCLEVDFEDYSSLYNVVYCFDMESKHQEAVDYLNKYIDKDPYSEVAWHQLGRQYFILEQYEEAARAFDYAIVIDEYFVGAYLEKAKTLEKLNQFEDAIENYKATLELDDATAFVFLRIGECYEKLEMYSLATQFYKKAVHEDPLLDKAWIVLTNLVLKQKKYNKALFYVNKALEIDENNTLYWRKYAEINLKLNYFEEAIEAFQRCITLQDYDIEIWVGLADVLCFLGDYEDALTNLLKAKTYFTDFAEIDYRLSGLYFKFKNFEKGAFYLKQALVIDFEYQTIFKELFIEVYQMESVQDIINEFKKTSS
ncbi:Tetratricopeptide repeat-containing protein [Lutibacter agarilyticus]|uniref:Tetratricopeptide repeat-containing protein n=2 Tax=Lutibacter agarilyticus TaxID=1109740 RepID=A0A238WFL5_9FLAO|nr:Tetratricopeptide repeat-containing protein [Lutibacter agarilyticus]